MTETSFNIIGDIAGNYKTLMSLLAKMPSGIPVSVGDMIDRGPRSKEVVEFFMKGGIAVMGNHEHLMIDSIERQGFYGSGIWEYNGGVETKKSYAVDGIMNVPASHKEYLRNLPLFWKGPGFTVTHAPIYKDYTLEQACNIGTGFLSGSLFHTEALRSVLWNRGNPSRKPDDIGLQIYGHNSGIIPIYHSDPRGVYAICIDTSSSQILTGINFPSLEVFEQEYIG